MGLVLVGSIFIFIRCGSLDSYQSSDASYYVKSAAQGLNESNSGRKYIGKADSESDCYEKAAKAGCTGKYVYYDHSNDCYCN